MVPASGSHFKVVYSNWHQYGDRNIPLPNGLHPAVTDWMKNFISSKNLKIDDEEFLKFNELDRYYYYNQTSSGYIFKHSNFYYHFNRIHSNSNIVSESDIDDTDNFTYLYPIEIECNTANFLFNTHKIVVDDNEYEYSFKSVLNSNVIKWLKTGKLCLLFVNMVDASAALSIIEKIQDEMKELGIPASSLIFLQGNIKTDYYQTTREDYVKLLGSSISLYQTATGLKYYPYVTDLGYESDFVREKDLDKSKIRNKKFLSFNRFSNRPHRLGIFYSAIVNNVLKDGFFSFLYIEPYNTADFLKLILEDHSDVDTISKQIIDMVPYELDTQHLNSVEKISFFTVTTNKKEYYENSYIHITSETQFDADSTPFFSEKTWRPITNLQPFIYVGNYMALNKLRTLGFKTFHPFIDESYDLEKDPKKRFALINKEIKKFADMSLTDIHEWYYSITDILLHNQNHLASLKDYNPLEELN